MQIIWSLKKFGELSPHEVYAILQLRSEVFVVEQHCIYLDADDNDQDSHHLTGFENNRLIACARIIPPGVIYEYPAIGRVVTSPAARKKGIGRQLMEHALKTVDELYGMVPVKIGAQLYLKNFYESLGFKQAGDIYPEDGIDHIQMIRHSS